MSVMIPTCRVYPIPLVSEAGLRKVSVLPVMRRSGKMLSIPPRVTRLRTPTTGLITLNIRRSGNPHKMPKGCVTCHMAQDVTDTDAYGVSKGWRSWHEDAGCWCRW